MDKKKELVKSVFDAAAPKYGEDGASFFQYFGKSLVDFSEVPKGAHVLDIATGRGAVLIPLANRVGSQGSVVGVDISPNMVQMTRKLLDKSGGSRLSVREMDAEKLDFSDSMFDFVFCGFALFFFPSLSSALKECKRVLKPGGHLVVSVWGKKPKLTAWIVEKVKSLGVDKSISSTSLHSIEALSRVLSEADFVDLQFKEEVKTFWHKSGLAWWKSLWSHGTRFLLESLAERDLKALKKEAILKAEEDLCAQGLKEEMHAIFAVGKSGKKS